MTMYPTFKMGTLKPKIDKMFCYFFCTVFVQIFAVKKSQILVQVACGDHIVLIGRTVLAFTLNIIIKCKKTFFGLAYYRAIEKSKNAYKSVLTLGW